MHRADHVLKACVFSRGKDPPGRLQLMDLPQPLHPGVIDDLPLGNFALGQPSVRDERYVAVHRVVAEILALEIAHRLLGFGILPASWLTRCGHTLCKHLLAGWCRTPFYR